MQSGTSLQEFGVRHVLNVLRAADLNRQVIKSDFCLATIPEIEFEIPPNTQKGVCNTLEGLLMGAVDGLTVGQADRMKQSPEIANRIQEIIERIKNYASGQSVSLFSVLVKEIHVLTIFGLVSISFFFLVSFYIYSGRSFWKQFHSI